jgi:hypothetical protein
VSTSVGAELVVQTDLKKISHDKSPELITLALTTLGSFDFSGEYCIVCKMPC